MTARGFATREERRWWHDARARGASQAPSGLNTAFVGGTGALSTQVPLASPLAAPLSQSPLAR